LFQKYVCTTTILDHRGIKIRSEQIKVWSNFVFQIQDWLSICTHCRTEDSRLHLTDANEDAQALLHPGHSVNTEPIGSVLRYYCKFGSLEIGTDRFLKKLGTEKIRYR